MKHTLALVLLAATACGGSSQPAAPVATLPQPAAPEPAAAEPAPPAAPQNPFFADSTLPLHYPPFDKIQDADFGPGFDRGMQEQRAEVEAVASSAEPATFENTIVPLERSGRTLARTSAVFFNLVGADANEEREKIRADYAPKLAAHRDSIVLDGRLFARLQDLHDRRASLGLDPESVRLIERYHLDFVRAGAKLSDADKARLKEINAELAALGAEFNQKVRAEVNDSAVVVDSKEELAGLSDEQIAAAAEAAKERNLEGKYVIALQNTTGQPPNTDLTNRALRERIHRASVARGSRGNANDTRAIVSRVVKLRAEAARMLGYPSHAAYVLEDETARSPEAVRAMLARMAPAAVANARREAADMQKIIDREQRAKKQKSFKLAAWDWAHYAEKVRKEKYAFDEAQLRPYLELDSVLEKGVFNAAHQLYGLSFKERKDLPVYHPDVRVFDVFDADGQQLAIFLADLYARPSKRGGAWMNSYVDQSKLLGFKPVVANHLNIPKPAAGQPTLLTWDEVTTLFHEFGHALHGMLSDVQYPYFSGTSVPRDFVEYPSQVNEMWARWPSVLSAYARHHQTGEPMDKELLDKVLASAKFNQGHATTEYLAAAMLDQSLHLLAEKDVPPPEKVMAFEAAALKKAGVAYPPVPPRYRTPYFSHIMGGYSAGYYAYIWSEVLDANSVLWFEKNGGLKRENGDHFRKTLLSRGHTKEALQLFRDFAGQEPKIEPLLERRGLMAK
jgi:peptidyl-dipeptidase Dcp